MGLCGFWRRWLKQAPCSADTVGRVHALLDADGLRRGIHHVYDCLKRNKALPDVQGMAVAVLDGSAGATCLCKLAGPLRPPAARKPPRALRRMTSVRPPFLLCMGSFHDYWMPGFRRAKSKS